MADVNAAPLPSIAALPPTTVRQLGSSNVLRDPSSVVKELIDNALDARTTAIFVDISTNTLDSVQVKDTGHGILTEDRPLVCRRYCTSKIRDFHDLDEVGGKWLGFRGEALASMAEISGTLEVTTRVEGEPVAVKLKYGRDGELVSTEHASAPVGTTVKATNIFQTLPVRKETALKESTKALTKIKRLMQAYAFARPSVRFSLRVLKGKSNKGDFMYAPNKDGNIEDAVLKIIGKNCALQCDWAAIESDRFNIHAFLPRQDAVRSKIANEGVFLSIDTRPISTGRGTSKKIVALFKERLRKANPGFSSVKDPFLYMNITCPSGSYDPNIEPAKDDVLFEREDIVIGAVTRLFMAYYPEAAVVSELNDSTAPPASMEASIRDNATEISKRPETAFSILEEVPVKYVNHCETTFSILEEAAPDEVHTTDNASPRWRSNMYGIDEEELELLDSGFQAPVIEEEEEGRQAASVSNPWTIARMNASIRPKQSISNGQLMTPAKGQGEVTMSSSSPIPASTMRQRPPLEPLTPQTSSIMNAIRSLQDSVPQQNTEQSSQISRQGHQAIDQENMGTEHVPATCSTTTADPLHMISLSSPLIHCGQRIQQPRNDQQSLHTFERRSNNSNWVGKPVRGKAPPKPSRSRKAKRTKLLDIPMLDSGSRVCPLTSKNNTDIRGFLTRGRAQLQRASSLEPMQDLPSFTPINRPFRHPRVLDSERSPQRKDARTTAHGATSRASSVEPSQRSQCARISLRYNSDSCGPLDIVDPLRTYAEHEAPPPSLTRASSLDSNVLHATVRAAAQRLEPAEISCPPTAHPRTADHEMDAMFAAYSNPLSASIDPACNTSAERNQHTHKTATNSQPTCRTTEGAQHIKSSRLSLERVPHGHQIHNVILPFHIHIENITKAMHKLDMRRNSQEWGYPADSTVSDVFCTRITERVLRTWVLRLDEMLEHFDTQLDKETVLMTLERSIAKALREREASREDAIVEEDGRLVDTVEPPSEEIVDLDQVGKWTRSISSTSCAEIVQPTPTICTPPPTINPALLVDGGSADDNFGGEDLDDEEILMEY